MFSKFLLFLCYYYCDDVVKAQQYCMYKTYTYPTQSCKKKIQPTYVGVPVHHVPSLHTKFKLPTKFRKGSEKMEARQFSCNKNMCIRIGRYTIYRPNYKHKGVKTLSSQHEKLYICTYTILLGVFFFKFLTFLFLEKSDLIKISQKNKRTLHGYIKSCCTRFCCLRVKCKHIVLYVVFLYTRVG